MDKYKIKYNEVYELTEQAFNEGCDMIGHKGGTGSGKTFDLMIFNLLFLTQNIPKDEPTPVITILSESMPHLKRGAMRYAKIIMNNANLTHHINYNKTDNFYEFNNCIVEFISADRLGAAMGNRRYALFANEIDNIKYDVYEEMARRSRINMFDFNPTAKFWLEDKLLPYYPKHKIIKTNYLSNKDLPEHEKERILLRSKLDNNFRRVHIDCEYGVSEGLVFENWSQIDELPTSYQQEYYGIDFGFTNSYTALVKILIQDNNLYVKELFYQRGRLNNEIISLTYKSGVKERHDTVFADSAEPKTIEEIYRAGVNIKPATEAKKDVNNRINKLKSYKIHITKDSINLIRELRNYRWEMDKEGNPTNKPIKIDDHAIDALGYGINDLLKNKPDTDLNKLAGIFH